ncbi:MAG: hypothetical protein M1820_009880 [Bogoriella megaspora]|nr:MAG: hypothetical protein M1820_009880 [Bogoriella megaspora]
MAPRRGGSSSSSSSSSSSDGDSLDGPTNMCTTNGAFQEGHDIATLVIDAVLVVVFIIVLSRWIIALNRRTRYPGIRKAAPWYSFGLGAIFILLYYALDIVTLCLLQCGVVWFYMYYHIQVPELVFTNIGMLLLLVTVLFSTLPKSRKLAAKPSKLAVLILGPATAVTAAILVAFLGVRSYTLGTWDYVDLSEDLLHAGNGLYMTYDVLYLILSIAALGLSIETIVHRPLSTNQIGTLRFWLPFIGAVLCVRTLYDVIRFGIEAYSDTPVYADAGVALYAVDAFLTGLLFVIVLEAACSKVWHDDSPTKQAEQVFDPAR